MTGRHYTAIPGPSVLPERVLAAMMRPSPDIYAPEIETLARGIARDLKRLAGTTAHVAMYLCNGHGTWEAMATNLFSRGDRILLLACGTFGHGWAAELRGLGLEPEVVDFGRNSPADPAVLTARLREGDVKAVLVTHVDTATSVKNDIPALRRAIDAAGHPALLAVDCIASMGCDEIRMDDWGVDLIVGASQKGLMVPPGLGLVWASDRAVKRCREADLRTPYWNWTTRFEATEFWQLWHGTAPTHHLFGLRESLNMIFEEGVEAVWARHAGLARAVWAAFDAWGQGNPRIALNVADPAARGHSVTAARVGPAPSATRLRSWLEAKAGVTLGIGLGMQTAEDPGADGSLRVAHMGHVNAHMTLGVLAAMQAGMVALGIPHGPGALDAAARAVAEAAGP